MIAAIIASDRMPPDVRVSIVQLMRSHPRFHEDFEPRLPKALRKATAAEQDRWYFAYASTWPDVARRFDGVRSASTRDALIARYNRSSWHYINLPTYLQTSDRRRLDVRTPSMQWTAGMDDARLNIVQALQMLTANWCRGDSADRALATAWIVHLVADLHQPLHATALFAYPAFIRGDRGGNDIQVTGGIGLRADNLHALWDGALGHESRFRQLEALARDYGRSQSDAARKDAGGSNFQSWAKHARALAASSAYTAEVRAAVASASGAQAPSVAIADAYREAMRAVAAQQIATAGRRIASVLTEMTSGAGGSTCARQDH